MRRLRLILILLWRLIWRRRDLWLRVIIGCSIGIGILAVDRQSDYDTRLRLRGKQPTDSRIVILSVDRNSWVNWRHPDKDMLLSDNPYQDSAAWQILLAKLLIERPLAIAVTTDFSPETPTASAPPKMTQVRPSEFADSHVIWSAQRNEEGYVRLPPYSSRIHRNFGLLHFIRDRDGIVRRFGTRLERVPNIAVLMARRLPGVSISQFDIFKNSQPMINYRGEAGTFSRVTLADFLSHKYPHDFFRQKLVIVGTPDLPGTELQTPLGQMSKSEILANIIDNIHYNRWIAQPPFWVLILLIIMAVALSAWFTSRYPQFLAFFTLVWFNIFFITVSLWVFDAHYVWLPVFATLVSSFATYVIFLSFQLTLKDYVTKQLEKEHQFLLDVEELKNNFLSLISHDLRTPIAKIQAICDRLLAENPGTQFAPDLSSLREVAGELNRYISTIIQTARVESKDFRVNKDATDINEVIERATKSLEPLVRQKKIQLKSHLEPMFLIEVDPVLIHEVVLNLIENAIKYTPDGGHVRLSSREVDGRVIVMVEDTGVGIPESEQVHVFEKFYRGEQGKSHPRGSGLGLYLVKYFIELHGGQVILQSTPGVGTKIGFSLPIEEGVTDESQTQRSNS